MTSIKQNENSPLFLDESRVGAERQILFGKSPPSVLFSDVKVTCWIRQQSTSLHRQVVLKRLEIKEFSWLR